jgi:hypothetical protein
MKNCILQKPTRIKWAEHVLQHIDLADPQSSGVFGENDPARRRAAINEIFTEDCMFYDPNGGVYRGRDEIDRIAGAIKGTHPDFHLCPKAIRLRVGYAGVATFNGVSGVPSSAP